MKSGQQLTTSQVYYAAAGAFETNGYHLEEIVDGESHHELARVYQKNGQSYVLYFPGKDNDNPQTPESTTTPLSQIKNAVWEQKGFKADEPNVHHYFIIAESNSYNKVVTLQHYVLGYLHANHLTIEDSMDRVTGKYDLSGVDNAIGVVSKIKEKYTGQQTQIVDDWQCGHFIIEAIRRRIEDRKLNPEFKITNEVVAEHQQFYREIFPQAEEYTHQPFFQRHLILKNVMIGAAVGFAAAAIVGGIVAAIIFTGGFAIPALVGVAVATSAFNLFAGLVGGTVVASILTAASLAIFGSTVGASLGAVLTKHEVEPVQPHIPQLSTARILEAQGGLDVLDRNESDSSSDSFEVVIPSEESKELAPKPEGGLRHCGP